MWCYLNRKLHWKNIAIYYIWQCRLWCCLISGLRPVSYPYSCKWFSQRMFREILTPLLWMYALYAVRYRYNAVDFLLQISHKFCPIAHPSGVPTLIILFLSHCSDVLMYAKSCCIGPCYNDTRLYMLRMCTEYIPQSHMFMIGLLIDYQHSNCGESSRDPLGHFEWRRFVINGIRNYRQRNTISEKHVEFCSQHWACWWARVGSKTTADKMMINLVSIVYVYTELGLKECQ